jgi:flagellar hook-associated protein 3 FlgL
MRVSTYTLYRTGELALIDRQRELLEAQLRISSGKRINSPADDPIGAADATATRAALAQFEQFKENQGHARYLLNLGESALAEFGAYAQQVKEKLIAAGNGSYSDSERRMIATDLQGVLAAMVGLANSSDGAGGYLFAGSREGAAPFAQSGLAVSFNGDDTLMRLEVSKDRFQQVKHAGDATFLKVRPGNGSFTTEAAATNTGAGIIDPGSVIDPAQVTGSDYTITFAVSGGATTYQVVRASDSAVVAGGSYTAPASIDFDGQRVTIRGTPADGDRFDVAPAGYRSIFDTVSAAAQLLAAGASTPAGKAQYQSALSGLLASVDQVLDHLSLKRAEFGSALAELDGYERLNDSRQIEYQGRLSTLEDLDFAQGAAELTRRQTTLDAAIRSYTTVSRLSLFNYLD